MDGSQSLARYESIAHVQLESARYCRCTEGKQLPRTARVTCRNRHATTQDLSISDQRKLRVSLVRIRAHHERYGSRHAIRKSLVSLCGVVALYRNTHVVKGVSDHFYGCRGYVFYTDGRFCERIRKGIVLDDEYSRCRGSPFFTVAYKRRILCKRTLVNSISGDGRVPTVWQVYIVARRSGRSVIDGTVRNDRICSPAFDVMPDLRSLKGGIRYG